jgi:hypothetical protein
MNQIGGRFGGYSPSGSVDVKSIAIPDDGGRIENKGLALQLQRLELCAFAARHEGAKEN